ncbi:MAG: hypothetical protein C4331_12475 [Meiothermus sp.]
MTDAARSFKTFRPALEESLDLFWEHFSPYATPFPLSPEPMGSPLLEVLTPLGPVLAFDRSLTPLPRGNVPILLHAQVEEWREEAAGSALRHLDGGRYEAVGRVEARLGGPFFLFKVGTDPESLTLLLADLEPPPSGSVGTARLAPPLMAFRA